MSRRRTVNTSFTSDARTFERLQTLADRAGVSVSTYLSQLVNRAWDDPDGYYLRTAAIQSFTAAAMATMATYKVFGAAGFASVLERIDADAVALFGPLPEPPSELSGHRDPDPRIQALVRLYAGEAQRG